MNTIHFRIDDETRRLAMQEACLEQEIALAFSRYVAGESQFISDDEMNRHMDKLKAQAARGKL